jgi:uncharacterized YigZ family protein
MPKADPHGALSIKKQIGYYGFMDEDEYLTIQGGRTAELKVKGSRFIGTIRPVSTEYDALEFINLMSKKYYDATHNCYAYLIGHHPSIIARYSDAGEPAGTAGLPILNVIKGKSLTNLAVVVTRYFGGTKLGKGGLARAYAECTRKAIEQCTIIKKYIYERIVLEFDYALTGPIMRVISSFQAKIDESKHGQATKLILSIRKGKLDNLRQNLIEATSGKINLD